MTENHFNENMPKFLVKWCLKKMHILWLYGFKIFSETSKDTFEI